MIPIPPETMALGVRRWMYGAPEAVNSIRRSKMSVAELYDEEQREENAVRTGTFICPRRIPLSPPT